MEHKELKPMVPPVYLTKENLDEYLKHNLTVEISDYRDYSMNGDGIKVSLQLSGEEISYDIVQLP